MLNNGKDFYNAGNYEKAKNYFDEAIQNCGSTSELREWKKKCDNNIKKIEAEEEKRKEKQAQIAKYGNVSLRFGNGLRIVKADGKWGIIDDNYNEILPCKYDQIKPCYLNISRGVKITVIDNITGKDITPKEDRAIITLNGKYGFVNENGEIILSCTFDKMLNFSEERIWVNHNTYWYLYDIDGNQIKVHAYSEVRNFSEGRAAVKKYDNTWGYINKSGEIVIPLEYRNVYDFSNGKALVETKRGSHYIDKWGNKTK